MIEEFINKVDKITSQSVDRRASHLELDNIPKEWNLAHTDSFINPYKLSMCDSVDVWNPAEYNWKNEFSIDSLVNNHLNKAHRLNRYIPSDLLTYLLSQIYYNN